MSENDTANWWGDERRKGRAADIPVDGLDGFYGIRRRVEDLEVRADANDRRVGDVEEWRRRADASDEQLRRLVQGGINDCLIRVKIVQEWCHTHDSKQMESNALRALVIISNLLLAAVVLAQLLSR